MIVAAQLPASAGPATGQSFECWLTEGLSTSGTGGLSLFTVAYLQADSEDLNGLPLLIAHRNVTDPQAGLRTRTSELFDWTKNLYELNAVGAMVIPGIREMSASEQSNLRGVYRKLFRKA
jgi:hypothetical protein